MKVKKSLKAEGTTNDALLTITNEIKRLLAKCRQQDALARYKIAVLVADVVNGPASQSTYGSRAVLKLAEALGWKKDKVYQYAAVPQSWNDQEFRDLVKRHSALGKPLSWSHCVLLAGLTESKQREAICTEALDKAMTYRELKAHLKSLQTSPADADDGSDAAAAPSTLARRLQTAIGHLVGQSHAEISNASVWCDELRRAIDEADKDEFSHELREQVVAARDWQDRVAKAYLANVDRLKEGLEVMDAALGAAPESATPRLTPGPRQPLRLKNGRMGREKQLVSTANA